MSSEPVIQLAQLGKSFRRYARPLDRVKEWLSPGRQYHRVIPVLSNVNLTVRRGKSWASWGATVRESPR